LRFIKMEGLPADAGTDPAVSTTESALVVLEAVLDAEDNEELEVIEVDVEELELDKLELGEDGDGVGLGLEVVEGGGVVVGGGCQVVVGVGIKEDVGIMGSGAGALPKDHEPEITPLPSGAKNWKRPSEKSRPP
jgi:hypothetical protein